MKRYKINILLSNGNKIEAKVTARNGADAVNRLLKQPEMDEYVGNAEIVSKEIIPIPTEPIDNERFGVTTICNKQGWYVVADLDNGIKVEWKKGMYNETNRAMPIGDGELPADALKMATILREIGEYLSNNFKELI